MDLREPLRAADPALRALAAEVVRYRPRREGLAYAQRLVELLDDPSPEVQAQARISLTALAGKDVGGGGPAAAARWREHFAR
jgi:HEAT repeat protein